MTGPCNTIYYINIELIYTWITYLLSTVYFKKCWERTHEMRNHRATALNDVVVKIILEVPVPENWVIGGEKNRKTISRLIVSIIGD